MISEQTFKLPDLRKMCPFKTDTNPNYEEVRAESKDWIYQWHVLSEKTSRRFEASNSELLVAHGYPFADREAFETICLFVNVLFVVDEVSDLQKGDAARGTVNTFLQAMEHADFDDGTPLCAMTTEFRERWRPRAGPRSARRIYRHCEAYIGAVAREAELRDKDKVLPLEEYVGLRRENSAIRLCFGLFEFALGIDLPDEVFEDEVFDRIYWAGVDMVFWANDLYSFSMEHDRGIDGNNGVTVLMRDNNWTLQQAADHVGALYQQLMDTFVAGKAEFARAQKFDLQVYHGAEKFIGAMENWVSGNQAWSFESDRYFGRDKKRVAKTGVVVVHESV